MNYDLREQRQTRLRLAPDPAREVLAGGIFEAGNLVEQLVIEPVVNRLKRRAHVREVHHPAGMRIDRPGNQQLDAK